jgi:hypothetical protein
MNMAYTQYPKTFNYPVLKACNNQGFKNWNSTGFQNRQKPIDKPKNQLENRFATVLGSVSIKN